jgi:hypothetical protein
MSKRIHVPPTLKPKKRDRAVVLEIVLDLPDELVEHIAENCSDPLFCQGSLALLGNAVTVTGVTDIADGPDDHPMPVPATFQGYVARTRVNDRDWLEATQDEHDLGGPEEDD